MTHIKRSALVHYSPAEMYTLVNDVLRYPEFLPWCKSTKLLSETETDMEASIEIARGPVNKTFTTHNRLTKDQQIIIELVNGPFKTLNGTWDFHSLKKSEACKIELDFVFEFDSNLVSLAIKPVFTQIANSLVDAFIRRAVEVYGERD